MVALLVNTDGVDVDVKDDKRRALSSRVRQDFASLSTLLSSG